MSKSAIVNWIALSAFLRIGTVFAQAVPPPPPPPPMAPLPPPPMAPLPPPPMAPPPPVIVPVAFMPNHFGIGNQYYEASVRGLRTYIESLRTVHPDLYAQLDPQVSGLETRRTAATGVLVGGIVAGGVSIVYAFASQKTCNDPQIDDPAFREKTQAWGDCNHDNMTRRMTFSLIGMGSIALGFLGSLAIAPGRSALMQVVNEHNRLSPQPIRWELGFGPSNRLAQGALSFAF